MTPQAISVYDYQSIIINANFRWTRIKLHARRRRRRYAHLTIAGGKTLAYLSQAQNGDVMCIIGGRLHSGFSCAPSSNCKDGQLDSHIGDGSNKCTDRGNGLWLWWLAFSSTSSAFVPRLHNSQRDDQHREAQTLTRSAHLYCVASCTCTPANFLGCSVFPPAC